MTAPERARIIKASAVGTARPVGEATPTCIDVPRAGIIKAVVRDAEREARDLLAAAKTEASRLRQEARVQAAAVSETAKQQGLAKARAEVGQCLEQLHAACQQAEAAEGIRTLELAELIAERLVAETVSWDVAALHALANNVIEEARGARTITLFAHPASAYLLRSWVATATRAVEVREDATLALGDVRLETDIGTVRANLRARIERLGQTLRRDLIQT